MNAAGSAENFDSDTNFPELARQSPCLVRRAQGWRDTVMDALADGLKNLDVDGGGTTIVAIVLECFVTDDAIQVPGCREG